MLERIEEIQGIGLLYQANGKPHTCHKATLIYADNGRGKSTLAAVLRSVSTGVADLITHRKTVDGSIAPKAVLQFGSGHKVLFDGTTWSEKRPEVLVFDADFIERNVYSGGAISTGHRKNLLEFALGEHAVSARMSVEKATTEAKTAMEKVQSLVAQLSGHHTSMTLANFEKLLPLAGDIDIKIAELQKRINAANNVVAILMKPVPSMVSEPSYDIEILFKGLSSSLEDIHAEAESLVKEHIAKLGNKGAEGWLSQGLQFDDNKACPYCGQDTHENNLIRAYRTHFNEAYSKLKASVAALHSSATMATASNIIDVIRQGVVIASANAVAWAEHVQTQPFSFDADAARAALATFQELILNLTQQKLASPAEPIGSVAERQKASELWKEVLSPIKDSNLAIEAAIGLIDAYKGHLTGEDGQLLLHQLETLQATKRRYDAHVIDIFTQLGAARKAAASAEITKKAARDNLDTLMAATLKQYETQINALLKDFGASFKIKNMNANFRGAAPRSEYGLSLRGKDIALEGGPPSFATALSEGDKRTLAFAFFIASTQSDPELAMRIVVIDDPMCSLDLNRRHQTRTVLRKLYAKAEQLIVLAHDPHFIRDLRDAVHKDDNTAPIAVFQLAAVAGEYTSFASFDVDKECESDYFQHHRLLNDFASGKGGDSRAVAKAIRPMLEGYLNRRFPSLIPKSLLFGQIIVHIRDAVASSPLCHAQCLLDELREINDYAGQFHHDTNPGGSESVVITASELKTFVGRALTVVHKGS